MYVDVDDDIVTSFSTASIAVVFALLAFRHVHLQTSDSEQRHLNSLDKRLAFTCLLWHARHSFAC